MDKARKYNMQYQLIKHNKTNSRTLGFYPTLERAKQVIAIKKLVFRELSYVGQFPTFSDEKGKTWSLQGRHEQLGIILGLPKGEAESFK